MNTNTITENNTDAGYETSKFVLGLGMSMAALVGIWGITCLVSALMVNSPLSLVKSYFIAVVG